MIHTRRALQQLLRVERCQLPVCAVSAGLTVWASVAPCIPAAIVSSVAFLLVFAGDWVRILWRPAPPSECAVVCGIEPLNRDVNRYHVSVTSSRQPCLGYATDPR